MVFYRILLLIFLGFFLASCTSLLSPVDDPVPNTYALTTVNPNTIHAKTLSLTLLINTPQANPIYQTNQMLYQEKSYQINSFAKNRWLLPPAQMLQPLLVQSLQNTGRFKAVIMGPTSIPADLRLDTTVLRLQQNFAGRYSQIEISIRAQLINTTTEKIVATRQFTSIKQAVANPYGGVVAANQAVADILEQIAEFCVRNT